VLFLYATSALPLAVAQGLRNPRLPVAGGFQNVLCLPKTISGMTRLWPYGNEATDGRVFHPAAACNPIMVREGERGGIARVGWTLSFAAAAYNLVRMRPIST
jgi:hypothetical protein